MESAKVERLAEMSRKALSKNFSISGRTEPEGQGLTSGNAAVGKVVFVKTLGQEGKITAVNGRDVTVAIGVMKMNVSMKDCILTKAQPVSPQKRTGRLRKVPAAVMSSFVKRPRTRLYRPMYGENRG